MKNKMKRNQTIKEKTLTPHEIWLLSNTALENSVVKSAFLFCCLTGLRFRDAKALTWGNIYHKFIEFISLETKMSVKIPIGKEALHELPHKRKNSNELVFDLPPEIACREILNSWAAVADIGKNVSWCFARHSFALNLLGQGVDTVIVSNLLGHSSLAEMQQYVRVTDKMKSKATAKLPSICEF
ncbi:MAG: integrase catalytic domain-containing protein [Bacteroidetes bacterium]|nr:integrase catalytic domain-containing protein [Bacteroidota bacterium]MBK9482254.1 integrase catalytic domain-containing protein [Bacteroidota bacterium]